MKLLLLVLHFAILALILLLASQTTVQGTCQRKCVDSCSLQACNSSGNPDNRFACPLGTYCSDAICVHDPKVQYTCTGFLDFYKVPEYNRREQCVQLVYLIAVRRGLHCATGCQSKCAHLGDYANPDWVECVWKCQQYKCFGLPDFDEVIQLCDEFLDCTIL